jgi:hypothetical protein
MPQEELSAGPRRPVPGPQNKEVQPTAQQHTTPIPPISHPADPAYVNDTAIDASTTNCSELLIQIEPKNRVEKNGANHRWTIADNRLLPPPAAAAP